MAESQVHTFVAELGLHQPGDLRVFPGKNAIARLHQCYLTAQAEEGLGQFATHGATTEHQQPLRLLRQLPEIIRGERIHVSQTRNGWQQGLAARGDDNTAGAQGLLLALAIRDGHFPGRDQAGAAFENLDTQAAVAFGGIVGLDSGNDALHPGHDAGEITGHRHFVQSVTIRMAQSVGDTGAPDQGF